LPSGLSAADEPFGYRHHGPYQKKNHDRNATDHCRQVKDPLLANVSTDQSGQKSKYHVTRVIECLISPHSRA
jgi:hypothetical protein